MVNDGGKGRHTIVYKTQGEKVRSMFCYFPEFAALLTATPVFLLELIRNSYLNILVGR